MSKKGEKMENKTENYTPGWDYEAQLKELTDRCVELAAKNKELTNQLENLREAHKITMETYEKVVASESHKTEQIRVLTKRLEVSELARDRLEGQMEVVRMIFGAGRNF